MRLRWRGFIAFGIAASLAFVALRITDAPVRSGSVRSPLVAADAIDPESVELILLERDGVRFRFEQRGGNWQQTEPIPHPVDGWSMRQLITRVLKAESVRRVMLPRSESDRTRTLEEAGLRPPTGSIELIERTTEPGRGRSVRIELGRRSLAGRAYARAVSPEGVSSEPDAYEVIDAELHEYALGRDPKEFRRRDLFIDLGEIDHLALRTSGGTLELVRRGREFRLEQPASTRADRVQVEELIDALRRAKSGGFVSDRPADLSAYGLAPAMVTLEVDSGGMRRTLLVGAPVSIGAQDRFGMLDGTSTVVRLPAAVLATMLPRVDRLIDATGTGVRARDVAGIEIAPGSANPDGQWISLRRETDGWSATVAVTREESGRSGTVGSDGVDGLLKALGETRATSIELGELPEDAVEATVTLLGFGGEPLDSVRIARRQADGKTVMENGDRVLRVHGSIELPLSAPELGFVPRSR